MFPTAKRLSFFAIPGFAKRAIPEEPTARRR
jgi:hypothetical protein